MTKQNSKCLPTVLWIVVLLHLLSSVMSGQDYVYATGSPSFATTFPVENGFINIANGNLHLEIPLGSHKQRGNRIKVDHRLVYDSRIWKIVKGGTYSWQPTNVPGSLGGWRLVSGGETGTLSSKLISSISQYCATPVGGDGYENIVTYGYTWTEADGTRHDLNAFLVYDDTNCSEPQTSVTLLPGAAIDASGYRLEDDGSGSPAIFDKNGLQVYPQTKDAKGNALSFDANGNLIDTAGRTVVLKSTETNKIYYDVLAPGGGRARYTVTTGNVCANTAFSQSAVTDFTGCYTSILSIELPDQSIYRFTYDSSLSDGYYGELTGVTLPTGGTVTYGYTNFLDSYGNKNRWISSRSFGGAITTFAPQVITSCSANQTGCKEKVTVSRPEGDDTVYTLTLNNGAWNTQTERYIGRVGSSSKLLTTVSEYKQDRPCPSGVCVGAQLITTTSVTTTLQATGQVTRTEYVHDNPEIGKVSKIKQWDYYTGQQPALPTREVQNVYGQTLNGAALISETRVLDSSGNVASKTIYGYDGYGNITSMKRWVDSSGALVESTATYDDVGNQVSAKDPRLNETTFGYDASRTCVTQMKAPYTGVDHITTFECDNSTGLQTSRTDENGQTAFAFDNMQRLTHTLFPDGGERELQYASNSITERTKLTDAGAWAVVVTSLDSFGRTTKVQDLTGGSEISSIDYTYDRNGRLKTKSNLHVAGQSAATDGVTSYSYDALDRITVQTQPNNRTIQFGYLGSAVTRTDENLHQKKSNYDAFGRIVSVWEQNASGTLNLETSYQYNALDRLTRIDQKGGSTNSADWRTRVFTYDMLGRKTEETVPESGRTQFSYDANGNLIKVTDARSKFISYEYDPLNRITKKTLSDREQDYTFSYDEANHTNSQGRLTTFSNGTGFTARFGYDNMGRLWSTVYCLPSQVGSCNFTAEARYDLAGNRTQLKYPDGRVVKENYDQTNRLQSVVYDNWNGQSTGVTYISGFSYGPAGNVLGATYGSGIQRTQAFNSLFATTELKFVKSGQPLWSKQFQWDYTGTELLSATDTIDNSRTRSFTYDQLNRLISAAGGGGGTSGTGSLTISGEEQWTSYQDCYFDGLDWVCYNVNVQDQGSVSATIAGFTKSVNYAGNSTPQSIASGLAEAFNSDSNSPVTASASSNVVTFTAKAVGASTNYSFSSSVTYYSEFFSSPSFTATTSSSTLLGGTNPGGPGSLNQTFAFDAWGNLKQSGTFMFEQSFDSRNWVSTGGYSYDLAGNMTNSVGHTLQWDAEGYLKSVDSGSTSYDYDPIGQRIRKDSAQEAVEFVYFGSQLISEYKPTLGTWLDYIFAGTSKIAEVAGSKDALPLYRIEDYLESLVQRTNSSGGVVGQADLAPFGQALATDFTQAFVFAGLYRDQESATDHAWLRQYSPTQGRWLTPDPYDGSSNLENPQSLNRYAYVLGNPLSMTDPDGLEGAQPCWVCRAIVKTLFGVFGFGGPKFTGTLKPRPPVSGGNFPDGESLGIPAGMSLPDPTLYSVIFPTGRQCEFGACTQITNNFGRDPDPLFSAGVDIYAKFGAALGRLWANYKAMRKANVIGADKYFHCMAHCQAASLGPGGYCASVVVGEAREDTDFWHDVITRRHSIRESVADSLSDTRANACGRKGAPNCQQVCSRYKVRGL